MQQLHDKIWYYIQIKCLPHKCGVSGSHPINFVSTIAPDPVNIGHCDFY